MFLSPLFITWATFIHNLSTSAIHVVHHLARCFTPSACMCTSDFHHLFRIKIFIAVVITVDCCEIEWFFSHVRTRHALREDLSVRRNEGKWAWYVIKNVKSLSRCHSLSSMHCIHIYPADSSVCAAKNVLEYIKHQNHIISLHEMLPPTPPYVKCRSLNARKPEAEREREMITIMFIRQICHLGKYNQYQYPLIWWCFWAKKELRRIILLGIAWHSVGWMHWNSYEMRHIHRHKPIHPRTTQLAN